MDVSLRWLRDLAPGIESDPDSLGEQLASLGAPVEAVHRLDEGVRDVIVGRVLEVGKHPNADRLSLCRVHDGAEEFQVVCGAPVIDQGGLYPFARVGARLPGGIELRKAKIRGEYSHGMLCSAKELGLGEDASGILRLPDDSPLGRPLAEAMGLDDIRLEIEVTANRGDLLSHMGIARELAPAGHDSIVLPEIPDGTHPDLSYSRADDRVRTDAFSIRIEEPELCPTYLGVVVRGVTIGPSPAWLQRRLHAAGARPINNVVDATNFVLLELGQPMHAFDLSELSESSVVVRKARAGESIETLDGETRSLDPEMLLICDEARPIAIAGVMGGADSEVSPTTSDVLIECALFDPKSIRRTRRTLAMSTDASYRFERGVDPTRMEQAMARAVELIVATAGGELDPAGAAVGPGVAPSAPIALRLKRIEQVLGVPFDAGTVEELLTPIGFTASAGEGTTLDVQVPGHRRLDTTREIDLIEEIARRWGYDRFPSAMSPFRPSAVPEDPVLALQDRLRDHLVGRGLLEVQTPAFSPEAEGAVPIQNPVSAEEGHLRTALLPGLIGRVRYNFARGHRDVRLFETGTTFAPGSPLPVEEVRVSAVVTGARERPHWVDASADIEFWTAKALVLECADLAWASQCRLDAMDTGAGPDIFAPGYGLSLIGPEGTVVGRVGLIAPESLDLPPWAGELWGFEVTLPAAPAEGAFPHFQPPPQHPGTARDLALLLPEDVSSARVVDLIRGEGGDLLESIEVFDRYVGDAIPTGVTSVAFRLRFRGEDRTLSDAEVDGPMKTIERRLREELDVGIRGA